MNLKLQDTMQQNLTRRLSSKLSNEGVCMQDAIDEAYAEENHQPTNTFDSQHKTALDVTDSLVAGISI